MAYFQQDNRRQSKIQRTSEDPPKPVQTKILRALDNLPNHAGITQIMGKTKEIEFVPNNKARRCPTKHSREQETAEFYIARLTPFNVRRDDPTYPTANMFGRWERDHVTEELFYVVYSYGRHFPMAIYCQRTKRWRINSDTYSRSTTQQQSRTMSGIYEFYKVQHQTGWEETQTILSRQYRTTNEMRGILINCSPA